MRLNLTKRDGPVWQLSVRPDRGLRQSRGCRNRFSVKASALWSDGLSVQPTEPKYDARGDEMIIKLREITSQVLA